MDVEEISRSVAAIEKIIVQVFETLVRKLELQIETVKEQNDLYELMTAESSFAHCSQLIGILVCTENAFE